MIIFIIYKEGGDNLPDSRRGFLVIVLFMRGVFVARAGGDIEDFKFIVEWRFKFAEMAGDVCELVILALSSLGYERRLGII